MALSCLIHNLKDHHELVICDGDTSRNAHSDRYNFSDESYLIVDNNAGVFGAVSKIVGAFNSGSAGAFGKIHIAMGWENLLKISLWREQRPETGEVFTLLKNSGLNSRDLQPFRNADINDFFPWLYYGKRFDVLRKVCRAVKRRLEGHLRDNSIRVDCHMVAVDADTARIVAGSL